MSVADNPAWPRRVLMSADTVGGVWTYAVQLCAVLARYKIDVALATMGPAPTPRHRSEIRQIRNAELYESVFRLEWMEGCGADLEKAGDWLLSLANRLKPDLIHLNGYSFGSLPWGVPVVTVAHSCLLSWWAAVKNETHPQWFSEYRSRVIAGLDGTDLVVAPSRAMLAELNRLYGPVAASMVIPNARSARQFPPGIKEDLILSTGRLWDEGKNFSLLDKIAPHLSWPVYVAGDGTHPNGSKVSFRNLLPLGSLAPEQLVPWFSRAAIYASPARYEPFGLSVLEAALAGCALVLGDIPSFRENWDGAALFASPDEPEAIQTAIQALINDPARRRRLAASAASRATAFSPAAQGNRYIEGYRLAAARFSQNRRTISVERAAECA